MWSFALGWVIFINKIKNQFTHLCFGRWSMMTFKVFLQRKVGFEKLRTNATRGLIVLLHVLLERINSAEPMFWSTYFTWLWTAFKGKKTLQKWGMFLFHSNPQLKRSPFLLKGQWCILCFSKNREWENTIEQAGHLYLFSASMSFFSWDWKKDGNWSKNCEKGVRLNWLSWNWPHCGLSSTASCGILADISHTHRAFQSYALHWGASVVQMWSYTLYDNVRTQFDLDPYTNVD